MQSNTPVDAAAAAPATAKWRVVNTGVKTYLVLSRWAEHLELQYEDIFEVLMQLRSDPDGRVEKSIMLMRPEMLMRPSRGFIIVGGGTRVYAIEDLTQEDQEVYEEQIKSALAQADEALQVQRMRRAHLVDPHDPRFGGVGSILANGR